MKANFLIVFFQVQIIIAFFPIKALSQDSVLTGTKGITLAPVLISGCNNSLKLGHKITVIDTLTMNQSQGSSLAEVLSSNSTIFFRRNGNSGVSTPSFRGMASEHTKVLWNGIPINSSSMSLCDFSILPAGLWEEVEIIHGGQTSFMGSGSTGGTINLQNGAYFNNSISGKVFLEGGSFATVAGLALLKVSTRKFESQTRLFRKISENNYPFENTAVPGNPMMKLNHGSFSGKGILQEMFFKVSGKDNIRICAWLQSFNRELPPPMTVPVSVSSQADSAMRYSVEWKHVSKNWNSITRGSAIREGIFYSDSIAGIFSLSHSSVLYMEQEWNYWGIKNVIISGGGNFQRLSAVSEGIPGGSDENREALFSSVKIILPWQTSFAIGLRKDFSPGVHPPLSPSIALEKNFLDGLKLKFNTTRIFNFPTMNMKFWSPGGNPLLLPEKGWTADVGLSAQLIKERLRVGGEVSGFSSWISNWFQWKPGAGGIWSPVNLKKVWSRGMEASFDISSVYNKGAFGFKVNYALIFSSAMETSDPLLKDIIGKQLIYVPFHNLNYSFHSNFKTWHVMIQGNFTGMRFTTSDNLNFLSSYNLLSVFAEKKITFHSHPIRIGIKISNLLNKDYQVMEWRPMPGRSFMFSAQFQFIKKIQSKNEKIL